MLSTWQLLVLAIIQGLTEFLPVSSSAHLILPSQVLGWPDQGPLIDVMAHVGSLFAVLIYFRRDVGAILVGLTELLRGRLTTSSALALNLVVATPPALILGVVMAGTGLDEAVRSPLVIAVTTTVFGVLLWAADRFSPERRTTEDLTWGGAFGMGLAQALALVPGTSRSGITMTWGRMIGLTRVEAARFSMLMSLPVIGAGGLYSILKLAQAGDGGASLGQGAVVAALSFVAAYAAIALFLRWVPRIGMAPFAIYRLALGAALFVMIL